jgi:Uma2 family endonuclease
LEPDNCFYFQNEALVRGKLTFDLSQDPPPDLALEIDLTSKSLNRFPIYAHLGVPEIWCYDQGRLTVYLLQSGEYQPVAQSQVFPSLQVQELPGLIEAHRGQGRLALRRAVRDWVRGQLANQT